MSASWIEKEEAHRKIANVMNRIPALNEKEIKSPHFSLDTYIRMGTDISEAGNVADIARKTSELIPAEYHRDLLEELLKAYLERAEANLS